MRRAGTIDKVLADTSRAILRAECAQDMFDETCRIAVDQGGFRMAWIGLVDPASGWVLPTASAGYVEGYLQGIRVATTDIPEGRGPVGTAILEGRDVVVDDALTDPAFSPWRHEAAVRGYRSVAALPLRDGDAVIGALAVYAGRRKAFGDERDMRLLHALAEDVSFGLRLHAVSRAQREAEARYGQLFEHAVEGIFRTTLDGRIATANPAAAQILGYDSPDDLRAAVDDVAEQLYVDPEQRRAFLAELLERGSVTDFEMQQRRRDGSPVWLSVNARLLTVEQDGMDGAEGMFIDVSSRRQAVDALRAERDQTSMILQYAPIGMAITALDGRFERVNDALATITGRAEVDLLSRTLGSVTHPDDLAGDEAELSALLRGDVGSHTYTTRLLRPDGEVVWVSMTRSLLRDAGGGPLRIIVQLEDVTIRRAMDQARDRLAGTLAAVADIAERLLGTEHWQQEVEGLLETLAMGTGASRVALFTTWTAENGELFGGLYRSWAVRPELRLEHVPGLDAISFDRSGFGRWGRILLAGGELVGEVDAFPAEERSLLDAVGARSVVAVPVQVEGELWGWLGFDDCDETSPRSEAEVDAMRAAARMLGSAIERRRQQDLLLETDERLRSLLESAPTGIAFIDVGGAVTFTNWTAEEILGFAGQPEPGRAYGEILRRSTDLAGEPLAPEELPAARVLATGTPIEDFRHAIERPDGRRVVLSVNAAPLRDAAGDVAGVATAFTDITDALRLQTELEGYAQELRRSNEELQQFAYVASHDLQEPLRMIRSFLSLLKRKYGEGQLGDDADEFIEFAVDGAQRLQVMIDDLLAYSRVETQSQEPRPTDADLALDVALTSLRTAIGETGAAIDRDGLPRVLVDEAQLSIVFQNLIANAVKFRGEQPPCIRVRAYPVDDMQEFLVTDNGIGIPAEHHERIFEIFKRLHTRDEYPGTGIGLAVCRRIVERHGGRIWVESAAGQGSSFHFTLPTADHV